MDFVFVILAILLFVLILNISFSELERKTILIWQVRSETKEEINIGQEDILNGWQEEIDMELGLILNLGGSNPNQETLPEVFISFQLLSFPCARPARLNGRRARLGGQGIRLRS